MLGRRLLVPVILLLIGASLSLPVQGAGDETPADEWVEAQYSVSFIAFDHLWISAMVDVHEADLGLGGGTPAHDIREISKDNETILDDLLEHVEAEVLRTIEGSFSSLDIDNATMDVVMMERLSFGDDVPGDPYREPISFQGIVDVSLQPSALDLPDTSDPHDLVMGTLQMGGVLNLGFHLKAKAGHLVKYKFTPPTGADLLAGQAKTQVVEVPVDARNDTTDMEVESDLVFVAEMPSELQESVKADALIDVVDFDDVRISVNVSIGVVDARDISPHFPDVIGLDLISADGIRMTVANDVLTWDDIFKLAIEDDIRDIEGQMSEFMEGDVRLGFQWVSESLVGYDTSSMKGAPVYAMLSFNGSLDLFGWSADLAHTALRSDARVPFEVPIGSDLDWKVKLVLPRQITLEESGLIPFSDDKGRNYFEWSKGYGTISGFLVSESTLGLDHYGVLTIKIEITDADTDIGRILGQGMTTIDFKIGIDIDVWAVPVVGNLSARVPMAIHMLRGSSDFIRVLMDDGVINRSIIDEVVDEVRPDLNSRISSIVGTFVDVRLYVDEPTLGINSTGPIRIHGSAKASKEKNIDSLDSIANVIEVGQKFPLLGKWGWFTAYEIKMPEGVEILKIERDLPDSYLAQPVKVSKDRRSFVEILDGGVMDNVTVYAKPTFGKTVSEALSQPLCFIPMILVIVTLVAVPYWWVRRKRMRRSGTRREKGETLEDYRRLPVKGRGRRPPDRKPPPRKRPEPSMPVLEMEEHPPPRPKKREGPSRPEKKVRCPKCGRRFTVDPRFSGITCPHCGHKGKVTVKKQYKKVMCPRCKHPIKYKVGDTVIKCTNCGKEGRVKAR